MTEHLQPLDKSLRKNLETTVKKARDIAEAAAEAALDQLEVGAAKTESLTEESDKDLRRRLRIHGRQLGDRRNASIQTQETDRLREEIAYQHWHRMLFARFLAENELLMYPDPDDPVAVKLGDCDDLVNEDVEELLPDLFPEPPKNGWEVAAKFAARMLPQIFRVDSPVFEVTLPTEKQQDLEKLLAGLPTEVFTASDSLGWVYQFWQAKRKDEVNASEVKIGARELPAVTQLFTEPYMVSFLLDNSLGAWWAARRLTDEDLRTATSEQELREKAALPGVPLEYLRFIRTPSGEESDGEENTGPWTPAAGTFDAWPESLSELKTLDPCCGSGHFLVAALLMLTPMRMELEGLSASEAVDRVLSENLHGLEIDQRCVELAAFALALSAWRFPEAGDYRVLPDLNVACCGLSVSVAKEEWKELAKDDKQLRIALDWMYDEFKDAPVLGSLLNPATSMAAKVIEWNTLAASIAQALRKETDEATQEAAVTAHGLSRAAILMSSNYDWLITNVPYLARLNQSERLRRFSDENYEIGKNDVATVFLLRCFRFLRENAGVLAVVTPQGWLSKPRNHALRKRLLDTQTWLSVARLGAGAFTTITGEVVQALLFIAKRDEPENQSTFFAIDGSDELGAEAKASFISSRAGLVTSQDKQLSNPQAVVTFHSQRASAYLGDFAKSTQGLGTSDNPPFIHFFWEHDAKKEGWEWLQSAADRTDHFRGVQQMICWENGRGRYYEHAMALKKEGRLGGWKSGHAIWGKRAISIAEMKDMHCALYSGAMYDNTAHALHPQSLENLPAIWCFCKSGELNKQLRKTHKSLKITNNTLLQVPFDLANWQKVAANEYPHGLPEPYSDDPTQWIFHGHPASSTDALQVAVARLLGYRWPAELDAEMELATDARAWVNRSAGLSDLADEDGIVCIPAIGNEKAADERLLNILHRAYEDGRIQEQIFQEKMEAGDENDPVTVDLWRRDWQPSLPSDFNSWLASILKCAGHEGKTLESWLRDKFFLQHCKLFHSRPFNWHIWDGEKDGFSVLVNYHKLDNKLLGKLIHSHLNKWISKQEKSSEDGHEQRLAAAKSLKLKLEKILEGESPHDIFIRWKSLSEQPVGWNPDLNDGIRQNIRPFIVVDDVAKDDAGVLRDRVTERDSKTDELKLWKKDRGKDVATAPWYHLGPEFGGKKGDRLNNHHLTLAEKNEQEKD